MSEPTRRPLDPANPLHTGRQGAGGRKLANAFIAKRRERAFKLRVSGMPYHLIAEKLDCSYRTAYQDVHVMMDQMQAEGSDTTDEIRSLDLRLLDEVLGMVVKELRKKYSWRRVASLIRILERKAKLIGLDAPARLDITTRLAALAKEEGLEPDEVLREAERILKSQVEAS